MNDEPKVPPDDPQSGPPSDGPQSDPTGPTPGGQKQMFRKRRRFFAPGSGKKLGAGPYTGSGVRTFSGPSGVAGPRPAQPRNPSSAPQDGPPFDGPGPGPEQRSTPPRNNFPRENRGGQRNRWQQRGSRDGKPAREGRAEPGNQNDRNNNFRSNKFRSGGGTGTQTQTPRSNFSGGFRKNRTARTPSFVGPMDHSYRNGNDNVGNFQPNFNSQRGGATGRMPRDANGDPNFNIATPSQVIEPSVPMREDMTPRIYCFVDDLFFVAKITETAKKLGLKLIFTDEPDEVIDRFNEDVPESERPNLVIIDLNHVGIKPLAVATKLKAKLKKEISIVGFLSHIQGDLKIKAQEAGCDAVMPRSAFSSNLPQILRKHGEMDEIEMEA